MKMSFEECNYGALLGFPLLTTTEQIRLTKALREKALRQIVDCDIRLLLGPKEMQRYNEQRKGAESTDRIANIASALLPGFEAILRIRINDAKKTLVERHVEKVLREKNDISRVERKRMYEAVRLGDWEVAEGLLAKYNIHGDLDNLMAFVASTEVLNYTVIAANESERASDEILCDMFNDEDEVGDGWMDFFPTPEHIYGENTEKDAEKDAVLAREEKRAPLPCGEKPIPERTPKKRLPFFDLCAANATVVKMLDDALQTENILAQAKTFIAEYRAHPLAPNFSCFIDVLCGAYVPRLAFALTTALRDAKPGFDPTEKRDNKNNDYRFYKIWHFLVSSGKKADRVELYQNISKNMEILLAICITNIEQIDMLSLTDFKEFQSFLQRNKNRTFLFFGDYTHLSEEAKLRISSIRSMLNYRDFDMKTLAVDEVEILKAALKAAGFALGKNGGLDRAWALFRRQRPEELIDDAYERFLSKTVFARLCTKTGSRALSKKSLSWLDCNSPRGDAGQEDSPKAQAMIDNMVGLHRVKRELKSIFSHTAMVKMKADAGLPVESMNLNFLFLGNPGTGKTTVAYLLARALREQGTLKTGHLVTASRDTLVGRYLGETALLTREVFLSAVDGVLFIDEAYSLFAADSSMDSYGKEALNTLTMLMTQYKGRVAVIMAGYPEEMDYMLTAVNPGLRDRFAYKLHFEDYDTEELMLILRGKIKTAGMRLSADGEGPVKQLLSSLKEEQDNQFANGRLAENIVQMLIIAQEQRLADRVSEGHVPGKKELVTITREDCFTLFENESFKPTGIKRTVIGFGTPSPADGESIRLEESL